MINIYLVSSEEDCIRWDTYVAQHTARSPYHLIAWKQAIENAYGHRCYYWIAEDADKHVIGVLPSAWIKSPISSGSLCALPFCDVGGALANSSEIEHALINHALSLMKTQGIKHFEHRSSVELIAEGDNAERSNETELPPSKVRMIMPFPDTSDALLSGFKSKLRSQIRKAEKNGLTASTGCDQAHLDGFYHVFARNMRDLGSPVHSKVWFEQIIKHYGDNVIIANVYSENQVIGAGIVIFNNGIASIPWASTNADFNRLAPNMLLYWTLLKFSNDAGASEFDFGRSTLGEGTYKFKSQWGATPRVLNWQTLNTEGHAQLQQTGSVSKARQCVEQIWRKLPVGMTTIVGPNVRKYISL